MNDETKFKLQAFLDGELSGRDARQISELLESDAEAKSFLSELQFVKSAMHGTEPEIKLPETREFYWSKIQRDIEKAQKLEQPAADRFPIFGWWKPWYIRIAGGVAATCALLMISFMAFNGSTPGYLPGEIEGNGEMAAITYHSHADGLTVVYLVDREQGEMVDSEPK